MARGVMVAGRFVMLQSESQPEAQRSVKVTLKDLPLHNVDNVAVLAEIKKFCPMASIVQYANI